MKNPLNLNLKNKIMPYIKLDVFMAPQHMSSKVFKPKAEKSKAMKVGKAEEPKPKKPKLKKSGISA